MTFCLLAFATITVYAQFPKCILAGDYPDPTIIRDGENYYMTHSPFYYAPGFLIWHSTDLQNWKPRTRALTQWEGSAMAPDLVKHGDTYYIYYPAAGTNWVIHTKDILGAWSEPIDLKVGGIDPGHVTGQDGKRYLYLSDGYVMQLTSDGLATVGEKQKVYDGWEYPRGWETEGKFLESPKLNYRNGYYYMTSAQGGTAGPPTSHMIISARSKDVMGPWENSPHNPIVRTYNATDNWWSKGHGTLIDDVNGNWWVVYHAYANGYHTLGRQTLIEPIEWTKDGWYRTKSHGEFPKPALRAQNLAFQISQNGLPLLYTFWKEYAPEAVTMQLSAIKVQGKGTTPADGRLLLTTATNKSYDTQVHVTVGRNNTAGLLLFYNEKAYAGVVSDGKQFTIYTDVDKKTEIPNKFGRQFFLKIQNRGNHCTFLASKDGNEWQTLAENVNVSGMHHNNHGGFYALRPAIVSLGKGEAAFEDLQYRNAIPTEHDMSAYLLVYFTDPTHGLFMALSDDGYTFTDVNGGKPIMAGDTIAMQQGIRDPHIFRGPDGAFYLAMTDLHIFAQRAGYRTTEWERNGRDYGWGNNRGLVLMKSYDLINWKRTNVRFDTLSPSLADIGCVWAPQVTFDEEKGKLMIYFTMRYRTEQNRLYYVYVNDDFDTIETMPQLLFEHPDGRTTTIDGDITPLPDGRYALMYVAHEGEAGIKLAMSTSINGGYEYSPRWIDFEPRACEAPNVWKRIGEEKWVLMYDIYSINPHNFGFVETPDFENFTNLGHFNGGVMKSESMSDSPKHGAVIHLTREEADRLRAHWGTQK